MKTFELIIISFLLVAITTTYGEGTDVVYDSEGEAVKANVPYYITFMTSDYDMWICRMNMGSHDTKSCPQQPVMFTHPTIAPTQVMFLLSSPSSDMVVHESAKLSIKFVNPGHCRESGFWRVARINSTSEDGVVVLNGCKSRSDSTFTIHKTNEYYMFRFDETTISLSNEPGGISKLLSKRFSGEMEVYFYRTMS